jgi:hypothetical protein
MEQIKTPRNHNIRIKVGEINFLHPDQSKLILSDSGDTRVDVEDTVTWIVDDESISSILVMDDNRKADIFDDDLKPVPGTKNWKGTVSKNARNKEETYFICWSQDGMTYCFDPQIKVNP